MNPCIDFCLTLLYYTIDFYYFFRSGSGKSTLLKKLVSTAPKKSGLFLINTRGDEVEEYKQLHLKTNTVKFPLLNKVPPNSLIFIEDLIHINTKNEQILRQSLNYDCHHKNIKVFCVTHTIHKNKIFSTLPLFHYIIFTSSPSNLPVLCYTLDFFKLEKPLLKDWCNAFVKNSGDLGTYFCFDCSSMKFYISTNNGVHWNLLKDSESNASSITNKGDKMTENENIRETAIKRFEKFVEGHPNRSYARALFSVILQSKAIIDTLDFTISFKINSSGKIKKISLVDYLFCLLDESDEKPPVDFKVVHHYFLIKKNVVYPMSFIKNKWFK